MQIEEHHNLEPETNHNPAPEHAKLNITPLPIPLTTKQPKVSIKYELFKFHTSYIKNISLNKNNILVFSSGNYGENIKFVNTNLNKMEVDITQIQLHRSISIRHNILQWSPDGKYLAVGGSQLSLWQWEEDQIKMLKQYSDDFYQIYAFAWSPNSQKFAVSSINNALSLIIRDVNQQSKIKQIKNLSTILSLQWDPFDKHLACLLSNNTIQIYSCTNWDCLHTINISMQNKKRIVPKNQCMKIDWSPDFRYLVSPAIDDKPVPYVVALDRNKSFNFKGVFIGPFSTINCIKFNPNLYELPSGDIVSVFAMGDSEGNITIWLIGEKYVSKKPLMFFRSQEDSNEIIQKIQWGASGKVMYATTFKKYLITIVFQYEVFGRKLQQVQKQRVLQKLYGSIRSVSNQFKIFRIGDIKPEPKQQKLAEVKVTGQVKKNEYVYTSQKTITEGSKMRIVPSMLVKAADKDAIQNKVQNIVPTIINVTSKNVIPQSIDKGNLQRPTSFQSQVSSPVHKLIIDHVLTLSILNNFHPSYRISASKYIQIQSKPTQSALSIFYQSTPEHRELLSIINLPGKINYLECVNSILLVYTNEGYIYLFSEEGKALELPMLVGQIHMIKIKDMNILTLSTNCYLRLFNLANKKLYVNSNILDILGNFLKIDSQTKTLSNIIEYIDIRDDLQIVLQFTNKKRIFMNQQTFTWHLITNQIFIPDSQQKQQKNKYPDISSTLAKFSKSFFETLIKPPTLASVQQLQYNLIFFRKHANNRQKYLTSLLLYIKQLYRLKLDGKLRQTIIHHFVESSNQCYITDPPKELLVSIKSLNSQVVNELIDMNLLK